jgi:phage terminase large subunit-like protein
MSDLQIKLKWNKLIPNDPTAKQIAFLTLPHREALYGGAAGGGKSDALLMAALQYADVPNYAAILFRRKLTDHKLPDSILNRAMKWLAPWIQKKEIRWVSGEHTLYFQSGASLTFGYLDSQLDRYRYQSAQFQFVGFDEATQIPEEDLRYLHSRIRKTKDQGNIPLRYRLATNPGGTSHQFIKKRFEIRRGEDGRFRGFCKNRPFIPAFIDDNPFLDKTYYESLDQLSPIERARLREGDWDSRESAIYSPEWFQQRYSVVNGETIVLHEGSKVRTYKIKDLLRFSCLDSASSERTGIVGKSYSTTRSPSHSVCGTFAILDKPPFDLIWLHNFRSQCKIPVLQEKVKIIYRKWKPSFIRIQDTTADRGVAQNLEADGLPIKYIPQPIRDKVADSIDAQIRAERGRIWLPERASWLKDLEDELFNWQGEPNEVNDQIDVLSSAGSEAASRGLGEQVDDTLPIPTHMSMPRAVGSFQSPYL